MINKSDVFKEIKNYCIMILGCCFYATSIDLFLVHSEIVAGGVSGLATIFNLLFDFPIGVAIICINVPIVIFGFKLKGWRFILKCFITVACLGVITDVLAFLDPITDEPILASLYGGILQGVGIGLFVKYEFSSGGTELLGRVINNYIKAINIPTSIAILDGIVVILGAIFLHKIENVLYALIVIFVSEKVSEVIIMGLEKSKFCVIISEKGVEIAESLLANSPRGVTMINGKGMFLKREKNVIITCVKNRQITQLKKIVRSVDINAFIIVTEASEVRGKGFLSIGE